MKTTIKDGRTVGRIPPWLRQRLTKLGVYYHDQLKLQAVGGGDWLDHLGSVDYYGRDCFVSEPYALGPEDVAGILKFCAVVDCTFTIWAVGEGPGTRMRILFQPR